MPSMPSAREWVFKMRYNYIFLLSVQLVVCWRRMIVEPTESSWIHSMLTGYHTMKLKKEKTKNELKVNIHSCEYNKCRCHSQFITFGTQTNKHSKMKSLNIIYGFLYLFYRNICVLTILVIQFSLKTIWNWFRKRLKFLGWGEPFKHENSREKKLNINYFFNNSTP